MMMKWFSVSNFSPPRNAFSAEMLKEWGAARCSGGGVGEGKKSWNTVSG